MDPENEIMKGLPSFEAWDETYVHDSLKPDIHVLQKREDEPWTWMRTEGTGGSFTPPPGMMSASGRCPRFRN